MTDHTYDLEKLNNTSDHKDLYLWSWGYSNKVKNHPSAINQKTWHNIGKNYF